MLSLYIHIPYCVRKCPYCGFYSTPYSTQKADDFIAALQIEAESCGKIIANRRIGSIYIGGGTPTVLSLEQLGRVIALIKKYFVCEDNAEFTIEANPHTVTSKSLSFFLNQGVNRLSLGIQSFSDTMLHTLGRLHTASQAHEAFRLARTTGFRNVGIDLMFGIPRQTMAEWEQTIDAAAALRPEHISAYSLSLDEGSQFMRHANTGNFALPDDELVAEMYELVVRKLRSAGFLRYEISNFSFPGFECRHNQNYWERGEYLGLGPGASSFLAGTRHVNIADTAEYVLRLSEGRSPIETEETMGADAAARETVLLGLRTAQGVDLRQFQREHGTDRLRNLEKNSGPLEAVGLLLMKDGHLRFTDRGFLLSDEALTRLCA